MLSSIKKALSAALLVTSISGIATVAEAKTEIVFLKQAPSLELAIDYGRHYEVAKVIDTSTGKTVAAVKIAETTKPRVQPIYVAPTYGSPVYVNPIDSRHNRVPSFTNTAQLDLGGFHVKIGERPEQSRDRWMAEHRAQRDVECSARGDKLTCQVSWEAKHHDDFKNCK